jgi:hypothetical protein
MEPLGTHCMIDIYVEIYNVNFVPLLFANFGQYGTGYRWPMWL